MSTSYVENHLFDLIFPEFSFLGAAIRVGREGIEGRRRQQDQFGAGHLDFFDQSTFQGATIATVQFCLPGGDTVILPPADNRCRGPNLPVSMLIQWAIS